MCQANHGRHVLVEAAVLFRKPVLEPDFPVGFDRQKAPVAGLPATFGTSHVVLGHATIAEVEAGEGGRPGWRAPPLLQLARVLPDLPDLLDGGIEFGDHGQFEILAVGGGADDGQLDFSGGVCASAACGRLPTGSCSCCRRWSRWP